MKLLGSALLLLTLALPSFAEEDSPFVPDDRQFGEDADDGESHTHGLDPKTPCTKASKSQVEQVNTGNKKIDAFLAACARATNGSAWCQQLTRPNPDSIDRFRCTYGEELPHRLINPDEDTWKNSYKAVNLIKQLESEGLKVCIIYNWWRPEPYNKNVGGAAGRHPLGTSVDVRMCSMEDMEKAFLRLCQFRKEGKIRAIGYYGTTGLHFGIGDGKANTWGKTCPN